MSKYLKIKKLGNMFSFLDCSVYNSENIQVYEIKEENISFFRRFFHFFKLRSIFSIEITIKDLLNNKLYLLKKDKQSLDFNYFIQDVIGNKLFYFKKPRLGFSFPFNFSFATEIMDSYNRVIGIYKTNNIFVLGKQEGNIVDINNNQEICKFLWNLDTLSWVGKECYIYINENYISDEIYELLSIVVAILKLLYFEHR
jgi:hypothetical protein